MREVHEKEREQYRTKLWTYIVKKEIPRMAKQFSQSRHITQANNKKVSPVHSTGSALHWLLHVIVL